jgi:hypothetical protein
MIRTIYSLFGFVTGLTARLGGSSCVPRRSVTRTMISYTADLLCLYLQTFSLQGSNARSVSAQPAPRRVKSKKFGTRAEKSLPLSTFLYPISVLLYFYSPLPRPTPPFLTLYQCLGSRPLAHRGSPALAMFSLPPFGYRIFSAFTNVLSPRPASPAISAYRMFIIPPGPASFHSIFVNAFSRPARSPHNSSLITHYSSRRLALAMSARRHWPTDRPCYSCRKHDSGSVLVARRAGT